MNIKAVLFYITCAVLFADSSGDVELCLKCVCDKKVLIKPLYTVSCSHLGLQDTFRNVGQWPEYSQQQETRMAVNFDWNDIKHLKKFPNIPGIVSLSFRHNKMTEIQGSAFVKLDNLKVLDLSYNQLTAEGVQADVFRGPYSSQRYNPLGIAVLDLGSNQIHALSPHSFEHLPNLMELRLNNNPLKVLSPATVMALSSPESLQTLDLSYTGLSDLPETFVQLSSVRHKLQFLYVNGNRFSHVPQTLAALGDSLQKLNLNDNPIPELDEDSFRGLLLLRELNISAMSHLGRIGPSTFTHLRSLEILFCSYNHNLTEIDEEAFGYGVIDWTLKELHLQSNALHTLPAQLAPWKELDVVDVRDNPWHCDCDMDWFISDLLPILENTNPDFVLALQSPPKHIWDRSSVLRSAFDAVGIVLLISVAVLIVFYHIKCRRSVTHSTQTQVTPNIRYMKANTEA
ncbi:hypothetical protein Cfor_05204 [Coptotermes formosanus]|uniref:LRRCT domain-containing protein n=1 Tax=Coptotermes formosanus TaxID=36987 RepID=A0A6L2PT81_COPFO|nr:hypothetical protein Cfor_05204 [Coptotermes formosanus]